MRTRLAIFCLLIACGSSTDKNGDGIADGVKTPDTVQEVAPSTPIGTLSGQTLNTDFTPLDAVDVTAIVGGATAPDGTAFKTQSKADGSFAIGGLPAGSTVEVTLSKTGYAIVHVSVTVPSAAGNVPIDNGNANVGVVAMTQLSDELTFQVVTAGGQPAKGVTAVLEVTPAALRIGDLGSYGTSVGEVVINADMMAGDDGVIDFKSVPGLREETRIGGTYTVTVSGLDTNGDKILDYLGTRQGFSAQSLYLGSASHVLILPSAHVTTPISIIASNVDTAISGLATAPLKNIVKPGDSIYFVFDQAVLEESIELKVTDESGVVPLMTSRALNAPYNNIMQVTMTMTIEQGKEYNFALRVTSADNGSQLNRIGYFFGGDPTMAMPFAVQKVSYIKSPANMLSELQTGDTLVVTFNQPIRNVGGALVDVTFDSDINQANMENDPGESGDTKDPSPYVLFANEPTNEPMSTFSNLPSGYTTRYELPFNPGLVTTVGIGVGVTMRFSRTIATLGSYRTIWDAPIEMDSSANMSQP